MAQTRAHLVVQSFSARVRIVFDARRVDFRVRRHDADDTSVTSPRPWPPPWRTWPPARPPVSACVRQFTERLGRTGLGRWRAAAVRWAGRGVPSFVFPLAAVTAANRTRQRPSTTLERPGCETWSAGTCGTTPPDRGQLTEAMARRTYSRPARPSPPPPRPWRDTNRVGPTVGRTVLSTRRTARHRR